MATKVNDRRGMDIEPLPKIILPPAPKVPDAPDYDKINVKMAGDRFLFQNLPQAEKAGRIFLPADAGDIGINKARIVGVGPDCADNVKVGDIIFKVADQGEEIITNQGPFNFLPERAIIAFDVKFDGKPTPVMKDTQSEI